MSPKKPFRFLSVAFIFALFAPVLASCGTQSGGGSAGSSGSPASGGNGATINVGTKDFAEEYIVGNMYKLLLEDAGFKVNLKTDLPTPAAQAAMVSKDLDLYPEYTGTGLTTVLKLPAQSDPAATYKAVADGYKQQFNFVWLDAAPMNNTNAFAMTTDKSNALGIKTISDMAAKANQVVLIGTAECPEREDCLKGLMGTNAYGPFKLKEYKAADPGVRYQAINSGQADVTLAFSTDGEIAQYKLVVLKDDKNFFPNYALAPVVRQEVLDKNPKVKDALNKLAPKLTNEVMQGLNSQVTADKKEPAAVAKQFLQDQGLIKK